MWAIQCTRLQLCSEVWNAQTESLAFKVSWIRSQSCSWHFSLHIRSAQSLQKLRRSQTSKISTTTMPTPGNLRQIDTLWVFCLCFYFHFRSFKVDVPLKTRRNGTLFLYAVLAADDGLLDWKDFQRDGPTVIQRVSLTQFVVPKEATFNLLNEENPSINKKLKTSQTLKTKTHIKTKVFLTMLTDKSSMSPQDVTPELARLTRVSRKNEFLPMMQSNVLKEKFTYLIEVTRNTTSIDLELNYSPSSVGKFRLIAHIENAMSQLSTLGFSSKDVDEVKEIFAGKSSSCSWCYFAWLSIELLQCIKYQN